MERSLQECWMPTGTCFGCGPANTHGLRLRSFGEGDGVVAHWQPQPHHNAWPGILCGGVIGTLLDCHTGAALGWALGVRAGLDPANPVPWPMAETPWATASYEVRLKRPAPIGETVTLRARVVQLTDTDATIEGSLESAGKLCATCSATWKPLRPR